MLAQRLQDFQQRLQRCAQRCQDVTAEKVGSSPTEDALRKAEDSMATCVTSCLAEFRGQLPSMQSDLETRLGSLKR